MGRTHIGSPLRGRSLIWPVLVLFALALLLILQLCTGALTIGS